VSRPFASAGRRLWLVVAVIVVFAVVGAVLVFASQGPAPQRRTFQLQVTGSRMSPDQLQAYQGDTLVISVVADRDEEIHLHGYDKHFFATSGRPATLTFPGDRTGSFVLEIESTSTPLGTLQVQPRGGFLGLGQPASQSSTTVVKNQFAGLTKIGATRSYNLSLEVGPLQPMYTPDQVRSMHPKAGEVMFSGDMLMPPGMAGMADMTGMSAPPDWRHLEVHVFDRTSGDVVRNVSPAITVTSPATGQSRNLPITTMQGLADGPRDFHYGNNVQLAKGQYVVAVRIGDETATFDVAL
jgi:hypothetical protein